MKAEAHCERLGGLGMGCEWHEVLVEDLAAKEPNALATGPFGSAISSKHFTDSGIPVIRGSNLSTNISERLIDDGIVFLSKEKAKEFHRSFARRGDLVFTCWGTINQVGYIDARSCHEEYVVSNKQMKLTVDRSKVDPLFLYYLFSGPEKQAEILDNGIGSSVPGFNLGQLRSHRVMLPPLSEQKQITGVLSALDDKIALLRETNATLEAIAQTIFKSWFVDFDPVRAKAEGREPEGVPPEVADLFPKEFEESELGAIPKGWRVGNLGEVSSNIRSQARPEEFSDEVAYIGLEHMPRKSIALGEWETATKVDSAKSRFRKGQLLFGKLRPYFHKVGIAPVDGVCSTDIIVIEPKLPVFKAFCLCYFSSTQLVDYATQLSNGAKMPRTNWQDLARYEIAIPSPQLASAFNEEVEPLLERIVENVHQTLVLSDLRDTLLPRLMSGKLRIPDIQPVSA